MLNFVNQIMPETVQWDLGLSHPGNSLVKSRLLPTARAIGVATRVDMLLEVLEWHGVIGLVFANGTKTAKVSNHMLCKFTVQTFGCVDVHLTHRTDLHSFPDRIHKSSIRSQISHYHHSQGNYFLWETKTKLQRVISLVSNIKSKPENLFLYKEHYKIKQKDLQTLYL